jgi:hypothetical protein
LPITKIPGAGGFLPGGNMRPIGVDDQQLREGMQIVPTWHGKREEPTSTTLATKASRGERWPSLRVSRFPLKSVGCLDCRRISGD